jgi:polysaccharide export outer membrane protein
MMTTLTRRCAVALILLLCTAHIHAQESLLIGKGDLLHITVMREADLEQRVRVRDSGEVSLALVGNISVLGLTPSEAGDKIAHSYLAGQFLKHPQVSVLIEEYATQSVSVLGQVAHPGAVQLTTPRSLLDVLSMAGGLTEAADRNVTIEHGGKSPNRTQVFIPNKPEDASNLDILVQPGDTVIVPKAGIVYVLGDVGRPGGYIMQDDSRLSVLQAVSLAAGSNKTAAEKHVRLIRKVDGKYTEQDLPLREIERGKQPDVALSANDVLYVPFSLSKNVALGATGIVASASSALIYTTR